MQKVEDFRGRFGKGMAIINYVTKYNKFIKQIFGEDASAWIYIRNAFGFIYGFLRYGTSISDYFELGYYKKDVQKREYCTFRTNRALYMAADDVDNARNHWDKYVMYRGIQPFLGRELLFTKDITLKDAMEFAAKVPVFYYKPNFESCGRGIQKIDTRGMDKKEMESILGGGIRISGWYS